MSLLGAGQRISRAALRKMWPAIAEGFGVAAFARFATIGVYRLAKPWLAKRAIHVSPGIRLRALALDAKYAKRINEAHWSGVRKYFQIRRLTDGGQAVDQVWLSAPGISDIRIEDDSIAWTTKGPDLPLGAGTIQGELGLIPTLGRKPGEAIPLVLDFLTGYLIHGGIALEAA